MRWPVNLGSEMSRGRDVQIPKFTVTRASSDITNMSPSFDVEVLHFITMIISINLP